MMGKCPELMGTTPGPRHQKLALVDDHHRIPRWIKISIAWASPAGCAGSIFEKNIYWLVVDLHLWKISISQSGLLFPKYGKCSKPPTSIDMHMWISIYICWYIIKKTQVKENRYVYICIINVKSCKLYFYIKNIHTVYIVHNLDCWCFVLSDQNM